MKEHKHKNGNDEPLTTKDKEIPTDEFDHAEKSLSEALRISFAALKVIMIIFVLAFVGSGFQTVGPDERALVLYFGKINGIGEERLLGPGLHWVYPYPIGEIVKIPVEKQVNLAIDYFWYYQDPSELLPEGPINSRRFGRTLNPIQDGYCLTRGEQNNPSNNTAGGNDYGIVHCKWQVIYNIEDPERFFRNVYVPEIKPGDVSFDVITSSVYPLLLSVVSDAVVSTMVNYTIDEVLFSSQGSITQDVKRLTQNKLEEIESGLKVASIQLSTPPRWPRQVDAAFQASIQARQMSQTVVDEAKGYRESTLNKAAGPVAKELVDVISGQKNVSEQQEDFLWSQVAGQAQEKLAQARAYRTEVVEKAKANAEYLKSVLPEYRKRPQLFIQELYRDTIETVLTNVEEKIVIQPTEEGFGTDVWIMLNRDPSIKKEQAD